MTTRCPEDLLREGSLKKQGGRLKTWKHRWFTLYKDGTMQYYNNSDKTRLISEFSLHGHELNIIQNDALDVQQNDRFLFEIKSGNGSRITDGHESFLLLSSSEEDREQWLFHIKKILYRSRGGAVFGHPLSETMEVDGKENLYVPRIVLDLVEFIKEEGAELEGIFRLSGRRRLVTQLMEEYDRGFNIDLREKGVDSHTAASVLKQYLRKLPQPLIPFDRFEEMSTYGSKLSLPLEEVYELVRNGLNSLPTWNYNLLKYLINFLVHIASRAEVNKMSAENLAAVHAPNILRMENENPELSASINQIIIETTLGLINNYDKLFLKEFALEEPAADSVSVSSIQETTLTSSNQRGTSEGGESTESLESQREKLHGSSASISGSKDFEKVTPSSEYLSVMTESLKKMLHDEQLLRQGLEEKLIIADARNGELTAQIHKLQQQNAELQKKLDRFSKTKGNFA